MPVPLAHVYDRLYAYCEKRDFAGADPFDGLNSRLFQAMPLKGLRLARLAWLQIVKRSSYDLRPLLRVPTGVNPKGLALFALAELSRYRSAGAEEHSERARALVQRMLGTAITRKSAGGRQTISFGYNFDWQSRTLYAPVGTAAVVPTAFACRALVEAYQVSRDEDHLTAADSTCRWMLNVLNRPVETDDEICFSYTASDQGRVYNASLLAAEPLAAVGQLTGNDKYLQTAAKAARFVLNRQRSDGAWVYGEAASQQWVDNFHTAYVLVSLGRIAGAVPQLRSEIDAAIERGALYWLANFFLDDGTPKYYGNAVYPIDIHSAAVAVAAMSEMRMVDERLLPMARRVAEWTIANMVDGEGYFYYQMRKRRTVKTPFMRWGQAWMAYALARLMEAEAAA
jgi:hypothetical protein